MTAKKSAEVIIDGKVYTLSGYEEEGYLQKVASYINNKIGELQKMDSYRRFSSDTKATLVELNIAGSDRGVGAYPGAEGEGDLRSEA